jgi:hypothetical protein
MKIPTFCGTFAAKLCIAVPENIVACILSPRFFSRPLDFGDLVRIFYVIEIARFIALLATRTFRIVVGLGRRSQRQLVH